MGVMTGITQLFTDLSECMAFFASMYHLLPAVVQLLINFVFGGMVLFGLMKMILRGV